MGYTGKKRRRKSGRKYALRRLLILLIFLFILGGLLYGGYRLVAAGVRNIQARLQTANEAEPAVIPSPSPTPTPILGDDIQVTKDAASISTAGFSTRIMANKEEVQAYQRAESLTFGEDQDYTAVRGITTFGGNHWRNRFTCGEQVVNENRLTRAWEVKIGSLVTEGNGTWTGTGWTGQPLIIQWGDEVRPTLGIYDQFKAKDGFTEVIYPAMDGKIYFAELGTGLETRAPIDLGQILKGTAMLDPRGYPLLFVGQGIPTPTKIKGTMGAWVRAISLIENQEIWSLGGRDPFSPRFWQAFDASPLLDAKTDTLLAAGENGVLYTCKLHTSFDPTAGTITLNPDKPEKYTYTASGYGEEEGKRWWGMENSPAIWRHYAFFADNGGYLQCVDLNTLELRYVKDMTDDQDASLVVEEAPQDGTVYLYSANKAAKQGIVNGVGSTVHRKMNAITGETVWEQTLVAAQGGGTVATPHVGHGNIEKLVIFACTDVSVTVEGQTVYGGLLVARDKSTGEIVWQVEQTAGYWSSPVVIYDQTQKAYVLQCDRNGMLRMYNGADGSKLCEVDLGSRVESTPAVFNNILVVGTRGQYGSGEGPKIIGVVIK
ncbi:MAG: pyrrolo-quinoline quinone [Candidatus Pelethousia sp.]|nr:pyrrolo-quinoline quinone [Candidatus Pelethousia sp.]